MKIQRIDEAIALLQILGFFLLAFILQLTFWPQVWQHSLPPPQIYLILFVYFSLHSSFVFSTFLIYGLSLLTGGFSSFSVSGFFAAFVCFYFLLLTGKGFFHWKKQKFFLSATFFLSFTFPLFLQIFSNKDMLTLQYLFILTLNGILTTAVAYLIYPFLENYRKNKFTL